ncbi:MAG: hypothetical protein LC753_09880 [Acidobacteria bacterium]|nr:hypothetical protein [Acidobacteriota bacterium]MCA1650562.1 hypothetical protein [Acidobacteriota bacterium]
MNRFAELIVELLHLPRLARIELEARTAVLGNGETTFPACRSQLAGLRVASAYARDEFQLHLSGRRRTHTAAADVLTIDQLKVWCLAGARASRLTA